MADELPALLKSQHQQLLNRLDVLTSRVELLLDDRVLEGPALHINSEESDLDSLPHGQLLLPPQDESWADDQRGVSGQETPLRSGQATPVKGRRKAVHDYEEAKEEGHRVDTLKRKKSADAALTTSQRMEMAHVCQHWAERISKSVAFNVAVALVIISNSIFLGLQLEVSAHDLDGSTARWFLFGHFCYAVLFTVEMLIRLTATGPHGFFCGPDFAWNWLDTFIVIPAWIELVVDFVELQNMGAGTSNSNFRIIRVFRVTRVLQVIRSVRLVRFISAFRELVISVLDTVRQLVWAVLLLVLVIYSFGVLFTDASLQYMDSNEANASEPHLQKLQLYFGGVYASSITLFRTLLAGFDWIEAAEALSPMGLWWVQLFHIYVAFGDFALLNVITGVFVNSAIKTRERDHETLMQHVHAFKQLVAKLWKKIDSTGLGQITITEFEQIFQDEDLVAFFAAIEVSAVDAWTLFDSLDADGDHLISYEEFAQRCLQLHGTARSVDLFALKQQTEKLEDRLESIYQAQSETNEYLHAMERSIGQTRRLRKAPGQIKWTAGGEQVEVRM
ncbi:Cacna1h [Symbiodinium necroappetens]|uniref:Cacna1h protein n=1 Tax=Symbiodinium necroappetens TaxID=1628268 RepID=A0A813B180_9DINO|nr:Cacna1h [Symbiodinium necroappetens]